MLLHEGFEYRGYTYDVYEDIMDDNIKLYQYAIDKDNNQIWLDVSPYHRMTQEEFMEAVDLIIMTDEYEVWNDQACEFD